MSDLMLYGVLRMPYEMAMEGEIARLQFYNRAQEALRRMEAAERRLSEIEAERSTGLLEAAAWVGRCQSQLLDKTYVVTGLRALSAAASSEEQKQ